MSKLISINNIELSSVEKDTIETYQKRSDRKYYSVHLDKIKEKIKEYLTFKYTDIEIKIDSYVTTKDQCKVSITIYNNRSYVEFILKVSSKIITSKNYVNVNNEYNDAYEFYTYYKENFVKENPFYINIKNSLIEITRVSKIYYHYYIKNKLYTSDIQLNRTRDFIKSYLIDKFDKVTNNTELTSCLKRLGLNSNFEDYYPDTKTVIFNREFMSLEKFLLLNFSDKFYIDNKREYLLDKFLTDEV